MMNSPVSYCGGLSPMAALELERSAMAWTGSRPVYDVLPVDDYWEPIVSDSETDDEPVYAAGMFDDLEPADDLPW